MVDRRWWVRVVPFLLGIQPLVTGLWAVTSPRGFYDSFPGGGRHWVDIDGPYNHHLVVDAGAGFLAVGVALIVAAIWARRAAIQVALGALIVHDLPHFVYHATHPARALSGTDNALSIGGLAVIGLIAAVVLVAISVTRSVDSAVRVPA
jgi:hypothetical protein